MFNRSKFAYLFWGLNINQLLYDIYNDPYELFRKWDRSGDYHCRYGGCELHAVASILGGCAAQEAIKLLTKQYVPVDNLFVFNAVKSETVSLKV